MKVHVAVSPVYSDMVEGNLKLYVDPEGHLVIMDGPKEIAVYNKWDFWREIDE